VRGQTQTWKAWETARPRERVRLPPDIMANSVPLVRLLSLAGRLRQSKPIDCNTDRRAGLPDAWACPTRQRVATTATPARPR